MYPDPAPVIHLNKQWSSLSNICFVNVGSFSKYTLTDLVRRQKMHLDWVFRWRRHLGNINCKSQWAEVAWCGYLSVSGSILFGVRGVHCPVRGWDVETAHILTGAHYICKQNIMDNSNTELFHSDIKCSRFVGKWHSDQNSSSYPFVLF